MMAGKKPDKVVDAIGSVLDAANAAAVAIDAGPIDVPLARAGAIWLLPWMCEPECRVGVRVREPKSKTPRALWASPGDTRDALAIVRECSAALTKLDSGELELMAASTAEVNAHLAGEDEDPAEDDGQSPELRARRIAVARFRIAGPIDRGVWRITSVFPRASAAQWRQALEILDLVDGESRAWARNADEAKAIADLAAKSSGFSRTNPAQVRANTLEVDGASIAVHDDRRPYLALVVMRHRMGDGPWDLRTHQQWDERFLAAYVESLRVANDRARALQQKHHAPRLARLLETPTATYWQTDFSKILFVPEDDSVTPLLWNRIEGLDASADTTFAEAIQRVDEAFAGIDYRPLGDYQHSKGDPREAYRVYSGTDDAFALWGIVAGTLNMQWFFFTLVGEDFWVVTATFGIPDTAKRPPRSSHRKVDKVTIAAQAAAHAEHVREHAVHGPIHPAPANMVEYLTLIDRFMAAMYR
jgi:hypothetical protein